MEKEVCCEVREEKTVNRYVGENTELIFNITDIVSRLSANIFGPETEEAEEPALNDCLLSTLRNQNNDLNKILKELNEIANTIISRN